MGRERGGESPSLGNEQAHLAKAARKESLVRKERSCLGGKQQWEEVEEGRGAGSR